MSEQPPEPTVRPVGSTEHSWCKAIPGGTGITVLALLLSKPPNLQLLQNALDKLQIAHPILRSTLRLDPATNCFSFLTPPHPHVLIQPSYLPSPTATFCSILEHELNTNSWGDHDLDSDPKVGVFFATVYGLRDETWAVALRLHTAACDRTSAGELLREMVEIVAGTGKEIEGKGGVSLGIEDLVPRGKGNKPFWARGVDMLGYSLNSFRLANLEFVDADSARSSRVVRLEICLEDTNRIVSVRKRGLSILDVLMTCFVVYISCVDSEGEGEGVTLI